MVGGGVGEGGSGIVGVQSTGVGGGGSWGSELREVVTDPGSC